MWINWSLSDLHKKYHSNIYLLSYYVSYVFYIAPSRFKGLDASKVNKATHYSKSMDFVKKVFRTENRVLLNLPEWGQESPAGTEKPEVTKILWYLILATNIL